MAILAWRSGLRARRTEPNSRCVRHAEYVYWHTLVLRGNGSTVMCSVPANLPRGLYLATRDLISQPNWIYRRGLLARGGVPSARRQLVACCFRLGRPSPRGARTARLTIGSAVRPARKGVRLLRGIRRYHRASGITHRRRRPRPKPTRNPPASYRSSCPTEVRTFVDGSSNVRR